MSGYSVAVVGATGLVGQEFLKILQQRRFPVKELRLLASDRSVGKKMTFGEAELTVEETKAGSFGGMDIAFFSAGTSVSAEFAPIAAKAGAVVIDNSAAFRMEPDVPLVVPEVNPDDIKSRSIGIKWHKGIIANPNCSTIQMVVALYPIHRVNPIKRIIADTYQSVSGTGSPALEELRTQTPRVLEGQEVKPEVYPYQIAFNLLPEIDVFLPNGYTKEEWKMVQETHKIMHAPEIAISATCVRVPVFLSHSEAIHIELTRPMTPEEIREILAKAPGVKVVDDTGARLYPTPWAAAGKDDVFVGRIRQDNSHPNGIAMWVVADNIRKGAALNGLQIAEHLIDGKLL